MRPLIIRFRAVCIVLVLVSLLTGLSSQECLAQNTGGNRSRVPGSRERSPWSLRVLVGAVANAGGGDIVRKPAEGVSGGKAFVTSRSTTTYELDVRRDLPGPIFVRAGYRRTNLDFGTD